MITTNLNDTIAELFAMEKRLANMEPALSLISELELDAARMRITTTKTAPDGSAWTPWSARRLKERVDLGNVERGLLFNKGTLLASLQAEASENSMSVFTTLAKAELLQDGTTRMFGRAFLGWSEKSKARAQHIASLFVEKGVLDAQLK